MRRAHFPRVLGRWSAVAGKAVFLGALVVSGTGCQRHYYYYYGGSPTNCPPATVQEGPVCEVPGTVIQGGAVVSSSTEDLPVITNSKSRKSKVVVSEANRGGKPTWKASNAESSVARTQVDGAIGDSTIR